MDVHLPQFSQETFFAKDSLLHVDSCSNGFGVAGEAIPEIIRNDNLISGALLLCFVLTLVVYSFFRIYLVQQYHGLLHVPRSDRDLPGETTRELRLKLLLAFQTCLLFGIAIYFLSKTYVSDSFIVESDYLLILFFLAVVIAYALLKGILYTIVNAVFFGGKRNKHLLRSLLLISASQGVLMYPAVLLLVYFDLPLDIVLYYFIFVVVLGKILAFYKSYVIFFRQKGGFLQIILYFCALEIVPLAVLVGTWMALLDVLIVKF